MRSATRTALTLGAAATAAVLWSGCTAKKQTEYIAGVSTQMQVPRDLRAVRLDVSVGGVVQFCRGYRVYDGKVQLPRSLGQLPSSGKPGADPITVTVTGFTEEFSETSDKTVFNDCVSVPPKVGDQGARVLRRSRQPYVTDEVLFLPMPLRYSCVDFLGCDAEDKTCKGGRCVDAKTDETKLPHFTSDLLDGSGGGCFSASECFAAGAPAVVVDPNDCTYAVPNSPPSSPDQVVGAPPNPFPKSGDGVNVEITYDGGLNREILDKDELEGFLIPDPGKPQRFRLAPGLCDLVKGYGAPSAAFPEGVPTSHRITAVRVSGTCRAKSPFQPLCTNDQLAAMGVDLGGLSAFSSAPPACKATELKPPKAVLVVVADDTHNSDAFYAKAVTGSVGLQLSDPAFSKTEIGLGFFPGAGVCGTAGSFNPTLAPTLARVAQKSISDKFAELSANNNALLKPLGAPVNIDASLQDTYAFLADAKYASYYRRAVLVIGNRGLDQSTCSGQTAAVRAGTAHTANKIDTYVLTLVSDTASVGGPIPAGGVEIAAASGTNYTDSRTSPAPAQQLFQSIVNDLATCVYDVTDAASRPKDGDILSYTDPIDPAAPTTALTFNAACSTEGAAGKGFGVDPINPTRAYLCKDSCDAYRNVLRTASLYAAQNSQPPIAVPVFAHKQGCSPSGSSAGH